MAPKYIYSSGQSKTVVTTDRGYSVNRPRPNYTATNGVLIAPGGTAEMPLLIVDYQTSFELAGSTGQSQMVRTFFPRNFVQPVFMMQGVSPNQAEYNLLGEFIHFCQKESIRKNDVCTLQVFRGGIEVGTKKLKGVNRGFTALGYVKDAERGGEFAQFAPEWQFDFTVSVMSRGLYSENTVQIRQLKSWTDLVQPHTESFVTNPDALPVVPPSTWLDGRNPGERPT